MRAIVPALLMAAAAAAAAPSARERQEAAIEARVLMKQSQWEEAARRWESALSDGASGGALRQGLPFLGRCYEELRNHQKALTAYQRALQWDEKNVDRLLDLARVYVRTDLHDEAIALYRRVLELDKDRHDARLALAQLYLKAGRWDDARREGEAYARWEPRDFAVQSLLAEADEAQGDLASAGARREKLVAQVPSPQAYYELGRLWVRAGQWRSAGAAFSRAEDLGLRTGGVYLYQGVARWLEGDALGAQVFWKKALERSPGLAPAQFFMALSAREAERPAIAAAWARRARAGAQGDLLKGLLKDILKEKRS